MFILQADKNRLIMVQREQMTSGSVNVYKVRFDFSADWTGLEKTVVFKTANESSSMLLDNTDECVIPWEVLTESGVQLNCGVYGTLGGDVVLPTVWTSMGIIMEGTKLPEDTEYYPPTPELWQQELSQKADKIGYTADGELGIYSGEKLLYSVNVSGGGLEVQDGNLTVLTTNDFNGDNTRPMTAAGVETVVGNIDILLQTI